MTHQSYRIPYFSQFAKGLFWTFIDSFGSQGLVILFHLLYRSYTGSIVHGTLGCLLSVIYVAVAVANVGLDSTLAPFLEFFSASRTRLKMFLKLLLIPQALFLITLSLIAYASSSHVQVLHFFRTIAPHFSSLFFQYLLLIFFFESMRKTIRTFLQLGFYFRFAAFVELFGVSINLIGIILLHTYGHLTLLTTLQLLLYASILQCAALLFCLRSWYLSLDSGEHQAPCTYDLVVRIMKTRFFSWVINCLHQVYSGNFLVPLCAFQFGLEQASLMKIISSISYWITIVARKVLGVTSNSLLAHLKSRSLETQAQAFQFLAEVFSQVVYAVLIFLLINGKRLVTLYGMPQNADILWSLLYSMVLLTFLESLFVLYEKWYIVEEDAHIYLVFNLLSIGILYGSVRSLQSSVVILTTVIGIRVATFILLTGYSFYRWKIWPSYRPHMTTLMIALVIAAIGYLAL